MSHSLRQAQAIAMLLVAGLSLSACASGNETILSFDNGRSPRQRVRVETTAGEQEFELWLQGDRTTQGQIVNLTVELHCLRCDNPDENLLYGGLPLHGLQPFMFVVTERQPFSDPREIRLNNIGTTVRITARDLEFCSAGGQPSFCRATVKVEFL